MSRSFLTSPVGTTRRQSARPFGTRSRIHRQPSTACWATSESSLRDFTTCHSSNDALLSALVETADAYRFYFAVYVRPVGRLTPFYMALIDPFRKWIVYPSLLRAIRTSWERR